MLRTKNAVASGAWHELTIHGDSNRILEEKTLLICRMFEHLGQRATQSSLSGSGSEAA